MAILPENDRLTGPLLAEAGQTVFDADFPLIDAPGDAPGACVVFRRERAGVATELALGDFTVANASETGFELVLAIPALAGDRCWIVGRQVQKRQRAHPGGGAVRSPILEGDAMEAAAKAQEAARDLGQAIMVPVGEAGIELPPAAVRDDHWLVPEDGKLVPFTTPNAVLGTDAEGKRAAVDVPSMAQDAIDAAIQPLLEDFASLQGAHIVDLTDPEQATPLFGIAGATGNVPTRWDWDFDGQGGLAVTLNGEGVVASNGARCARGVQRAGRTFCAEVRLNVEDAFAWGQNGPVIGFTTSDATGADATLAAGDILFCGRGGDVYAETSAGGPAASEWTPVRRDDSQTLNPSLAGEVMELRITLNDQAPHLAELIHNGRTARFDLPRVSTGVFYAAARQRRLPGQQAPTDTVIRARWSDGTITRVTQDIEIDARTVLAIGGADPLPTPRYASPITFSADDAGATRVRKLPPGMQALPIMPQVVHGPGKVTTSDLLPVFAARHSIFQSAIAYVSPTGNNGTAVIGDRTKPFTLAHALRNLTAAQAKVIVALPGDYDPVEYRLTDTGAGAPKLVLAERVGTCRMRGPAPSVQSAFALDGVTAGMYRMTWTGGQAGVHRLKMGSPIGNYDPLDPYGFHAGIPRFASYATLAASGFGFWSDIANKTLYVMLGGLDVSTVASRLKAYWTDAAGNARLMLLGAEAMFLGWWLDGVKITLLNSGTTRSIYWDEDTLQTFAQSHALDDSGGAGEGWAYRNRLRLHGPDDDGGNLGYSGTLPGRSSGLIANSWVSGCGDPWGIDPASQPTNNQAGWSHGGDMSVFGSVIEDNWGQQLADISQDTGANITWLVGVLARQRSVSVGAGATGFEFVGNTGDGVSARDRKAFIDTCEAQGFPAGGALRLSEGASARVFNSPTLLASSTITAPSTAPTAYSPENP